MMQKLTALFLLLLTFSKAHAETFAVTSNADIGPGTLREALEKAAANGAAQTDFIHFALSTAIANRTIALKTELPLLTSNLIIDASTQAGSAIGATEAKVRITAAPNTTLDYVFMCVDIRDIAIYSLHFYNLIRGESGLWGTIAIALHNVDNVRIGAATKGNYFTKAGRPVGTANAVGLGGTSLVTNFMFQANIVNLTEDGSAIDDWWGEAIGLPKVANVTIGGTAPGEGNFFAGNDEYCIVFQMDESASFDAGYFKIINNYFGCDITKTKALNCGQVFIENQKNYGAVEKADVSIISNLFNKYPPGMSFSLYPCFVVSNIDGFIDVRGNRISSNMAGSNGFSIVGCGDGRIGGDNPEDQNIISYCTGSGIALNRNKAITISKNSIYCNFPGIKVLSSVYEVPITKITTLTDHTVQGTTLPNSKVEIFLTKTCGSCENGEQYLGTVPADNTGNWSFTSSVLLDGPVTATGTSPQGVTGEFAHPEINSAHLDINYIAACDKSTGYIKGLEVVAATRSYWLLPPYGFDTIFNQLDLDHLPAGLYQFRAEQGPYCYAQYNVGIGDYTPRINATMARLVQPSCNQKNGAVADVYAAGAYDKLFWRDASGKVVGTEQTLSGVGPGRYKLVILSEKYGCGDSTGFFTLANQSGPSVVMTNVKITDAKCGTATGSIQQLKVSNVTGNALIKWLDADDQVVGRALDLMNIPGGAYRMVLHDDSHCDITTEPIEVGGSGKTQIDVSNIAIMPSQCRYGSGRITGVSVTGATDYEWRNQKGDVVSREKDPVALLPGRYTLTAGQATGCPKTSPVLTIPVEPDMHLDPALQTTITPATCGQPNGSVVLQNFPMPASYRFAWKQNEITAATTPDLKNAAPGTYTLYASDATGCIQRVTTAAVAAIAPPQLQTAAVQIKNDVCTQQTGSIQNLSLQGGTAPFSYQWLHNQQQPVSNTINLQNRGAGTYQLVVTDAFGCTVKSALFALTNETKTLRTPHYADQLIPRNTSTTLTPQNTDAGTYEWFADAALTQLLGTNNTGVFVTSNLPADKTFYIRLREGTCNSGTTAVTVKVADDAKVYVPTGFTPNKDGKNDAIKPLVTGIFKLDYFTIYNRWGEVVFKTNDLAKGWDGFIKGLEAPVGAYVWMLKGTDYKGTIIQQKGSFILIR